LTQRTAGLPHCIVVEEVEAPDFERRYPLPKLRAFDLIFVGGRDSSNAGLGAITNQVLDTTLKPFLADGGALLLFHDVVGGPWDSLLEGFRFDSVLDPFRPPYYKLRCEATLVLSHPGPCKLPEKIRFEGTHGRHISDAHTIFKTEEFAYYWQCGRVGVTEMGHLPPSTEDEWALLVNVVHELCFPESDS
jgi:hypothetical protein